MDAKLAQLKELGALKEAGVLTDFEFETAEEPHPQRLTDDPGTRKAPSE